MASVIRLENVSKTYVMGETSVEALKDINLNIDEGEFISIVGPSGSGKSTLMHIIGLLDRPTKGRVFLEEKDIVKLSPTERALMRNKHIGFVFQSFNLLPRTTALENVELPLIYSDIKRAERIEKAKEVLATVGLSDRLNHTSAQLSGGQQQRVAIARALVNNPSVILADEPTGNLDSKSGLEILKLISELNKQGNTVVLVTHDAKVASFTNRKVELMDGSIISDKKI